MWWESSGPRVGAGGKESVELRPPSQESGHSLASVMSEVPGLCPAVPALLSNPQTSHIVRPFRP